MTMLIIILLLLSFGEAFKLTNLDFNQLCRSLKDCSISTQHIDKISINNLSNLLDSQKLTKTHTTVFLIIVIDEPLKYDDHNTLEIVINARPWWWIRSQPLFSSSESPQTIILQRVPYHLEPSLRALAAIQFPSNENECQNKSVYFSYQDGTWGNGLLVMMIEYIHNYNSVNVPFTSRTGNLNDKVFLADSNACSTIKNKWQCLFANSTSCLTPNVVTNCYDRNCLPIGKVYSKASLEGVLLSDDQVKSLYKNNDNIIKKFEYNNLLKQSVRIKTTDDSNIFTINKIVKQTESIEVEYHKVNLVFGMLTRFNSKFRNDVQQVCLFLH